MAQIIPTLPPDFKVAVVRDQSEFIENSLHAIEEHLVLGAIFAAVVVFFFLWNFRSTIIAALAIPTSIIAAFALIAALGYSLNQMTMLALTLMVGIVIDDAIVVLENIYRFVEEKGMDPFQAAIEGTREIGLAVLATTLSLLAVFIPVGFMTGIVGRFMSSFGLTSAAAIAVSLIVSFTLTPMLAARWIKRAKARRTESPDGRRSAFRARFGDQDISTSDSDHAEKRRPTKAQSKAGWFYSNVDGTYTWLLKLAMRFRWAVVLICVITVASIVSALQIRRHGLFARRGRIESFRSTSAGRRARRSRRRNRSSTASPATSANSCRASRIRSSMPADLAAAGSAIAAVSMSVSCRSANGARSQADLINQTRQIVKQYSSNDYRVNVSASVVDRREHRPGPRRFGHRLLHRRARTWTSSTTTPTSSSRR